MKCTIRRWDHVPATDGFAGGMAMDCIDQDKMGAPAASGPWSLAEPANDTDPDGPPGHGADERSAPAQLRLIRPVARARFL